MSGTVLVVDDEKDILDVVEFNLTQSGFNVHVAPDGRTAVEFAREHKPDLILLDLMLPDLSGTEVLRLLRANPSTRDIPIVFLTARGEEIDRIVGFELGADDYVTKPFSVRELVLRVKAVLRRPGIEEPVAPLTTARSINIGPIELDPAEYRVRVGGREVDLTLTEFKLLSELVRANGRLKTRGSLLSEVWGYDSEVMSRTVDTHIRRLREKLGNASSWLRTVRGVGYRLQDPRSE